MYGKFILIIALILVGGVAAAAQSTDQSNPTPIGSNELTITGPKKSNQQFYYNFTAGPGEVTLQFNVKAKSSSTYVGVKVFDAELNTLTDHNMSAETSPSMALKKFDVGTKQTLLMSFTSDSSLGECKIKFGGAVEFSGTESPVSSAATDSNSTAQTQSADQSAGASGSGKNKAFIFSILDAAGQRFNIPATGKLRIEMKDGSMQEVDLTQVKKILLKQ